ncbi:MAG: GFA family protein [Polyangiaceae bacterium]|nr:GFA family protein [Polyangiaceae bacterium]
MTESTGPATHQGSCHCGKVRFEAKVDLGNVIACNCSICSRSGYVLTFVGQDAFELKAGEDALTDYQFGEKNIHHLFCATCGVRAFGRGTTKDGTPMFAVNVRCLEGVDADSLNITRMDGKSL